MDTSNHDYTTHIVRERSVKIICDRNYNVLKIKLSTLHYIENYSILYVDKRAPIGVALFFTVGGTNFVRETPKRILGIVKGRIT